MIRHGGRSLERWLEAGVGVSLEARGKERPFRSWLKRGFLERRGPDVYALTELGAQYLRTHAPARREGLAGEELARRRRLRAEARVKIPHERTFPTLHRRVRRGRSIPTRGDGKPHAESDRER